MLTNRTVVLSEDAYERILVFAAVVGVPIESGSGPGFPL